MSWPYLFRAGHAYVAGFDKPGVVGIGTIRDKVEDKGFQVLAAYECADVPGLPFAVRGSCPDDWDWIGLVRRTGPTELIDVPDRVWWIVEIPPAEAPPPPTPGAPPPELPPFDKCANVTSRPAVTYEHAYSAVGAGLAVGVLVGGLALALGARRLGIGAAGVLAAGAVLGGVGGGAWALRWQG